MVLGLGNVLLGDDGIGPAVCGLLRTRVASAGPSEELPAGTELVDGGTRGSAMVPWLIDASAVVIVDAVRTAGRPGEVLVYRAPDWPIPSRECGDGLESMLALAVIGGLSPEAITLVGIIPARIGPGLCLSKEVRRAVPLAASVAAREIRALTGGIA